MSKVIDERVVEMRFDNRHFEQNVKTSMSTLDKLKNALNFKGASKGLENLNTSVNKVNMTPLGKGIEAVHAKFSALEVMGVTALANITNSAVNAGKRIASALTIDPIKTGLSEYETKMNAIQVIQANTRGKNNMDDITKALDDLNDYADKTIYNFAQMTSNVGKFTAQGYDVFGAANAVKGLANLAAASGASAEDMSRATYQMSQALGSSIKLMDWNSLRNANMATVELKNTLIDLAKVNGIAIDDMIEKHGSFEQTLSEGWLSGDMFTEAMNIYSGIYSDAELKAKGFTDKQIENFKGLAAMAESAATEVKTFTQLWDVLKETAQSGWTQTWELLVGDFDTAKENLTKLQVYFSGIIDSWSDARNTLLGGALHMTTPWTKIMDKLDSAGLGKIKKVADTVGDLTDKLSKYQEVVDKVWRGDFGNADTGRFEKLDKAGWDHRVVQDLVNKGKDYKLTVEDIEASHKKFGLTIKKSTEETKTATSTLANLSDEQLKNAGLTESEIKLYKDLAAEADKTGISIEELAEKMSKKDGRTLLIESFKNAWSGLASIFKAVHDAWVDIFPPMSVVQLYGIIEAINKFSQHLVVGDETADKLKRTLKGVFAIVDILTTIFGGAFKTVIRTVATLLGKADIDILSITASIGDAVVKVRDWIDAHNIFAKGFEIILPYLKKAADAFGDWVDKLKESDNIPRDIVLGLVNGLKAGVKTVVDIIVELGTSLLNAIKKVLGIHSPSTEFFEIGKNIIQGLLKGLTEGPKMIIEALINLGKKIISAFKDIFDKLPKDEATHKVSDFFTSIKNCIEKIDYGKLFAAALLVGILHLADQINKTVQMFVSPMKSLGDMFKSFGGLADTIKKRIDGTGKKWESIAKSILMIAGAFVLLSAAVYLLSTIKTRDLIKAGIAIVVLSGVLIGLSWALNKINSTIEVGGFKGTALLAMAGSLLLIAFALQKLSKIKIDNVPMFLLALGSCIFSFAAILKTFGKFVKGDAAANIHKAGSMLIKMSIALLLMVYVIKLIGKLDGATILKGIAVIGVFELMCMALIAVSKLAGDNASKAGGMLLKISIAMLIMVGVVKLAGMLDSSEVYKGLKVISGVGLLFTALIAVSLLAGKNASKAGGMLLMISGAMMLMVGAIKLISMMDDADIKKGLDVIESIGLIFAGLIAVSLLSGKNAAKAGAMLLLISGALVVMTGAIWILSTIDPDGLNRGLDAVKILGGLFTALIAVSKLAGGSAGGLIALTIGIGLLVATLIALTFIDRESLTNATVALSAVIGMFALLVYSTKYAKNIKVSSIIGLVTIAGILAALMWAVKKIKPEGNLETMASLSIMLVAMAGVLKILEKFDMKFSNMGKVLLAMAGLGIIVGEMGVILGLLKKHGSGTSINTVIDISLMLGAMAGVLRILEGFNMKISNIGKVLLAMAGLGIIVGEMGVILGGLNNLTMSVDQVEVLSLMLYALLPVLFALSIMGPLVGKNTYGAIGAMALLGLVVAELGFIMGSLDGMDLHTSLETAKALSLLLLSMSGCLVVLSIVGAMSAGVYPGMLALGIFIAGVGGLLYALGSLSEDAADVINNGVPILNKIGGAIGSFVGSIVDGISGTATESLPELGTKLSSFMDNSSGFIEGASSISDGSMSGVQSLVDAILALTAADLLSVVKEKLGLGSNDMEEFGAMLDSFGRCMVNFSSIVAGNIDSEAVTAAANAGAMLADLANTIPNSGGKLGEWLGENDIDDFGAMLVPFGECMVAFSQTVAGNIDTDAVESAANAGQIMADLADTLPNSGGVLEFFTGGNDIDDFGAMIVPFGEAIAAFSQTVAGNIDTDAVESAANAGQMMADFATTLPNSGGVVEFFTGGNDMDDFGEMLVAFGECMVDFSDTISGNIDMDAVNSAAKAGEMFSAIANSIPDSGSIFDIFTGDTSIEEFGEQLVEFGESMVDFSSAISGNIDDASITSAINATNDIVKLAEILPKCENISKIDDTLIDFATGMVTFSEKITGQVDTESITQVSNAGKTLAEMADIMPEEVDLARITNGLQEFGEAIVAFSDVVDEGLDKGALTTATNAGKGIAHIAATIPTDVDYSSFITFVNALGGSLVKFCTSIQNGLSLQSVWVGVSAGKAITGFMSTIPVTDVSNFTDNAGKVASSIVAFSAKSNGTINSDAVDKGVANGEKIADFMADIKTNSVDVFVNNAGLVASAIVSFYNKVKENFDFMTISLAVGAGKSIADFMANIKTNSVSTFTSNAGLVADAIVSFNSKVKDNIANDGSLDTAIAAGKSIANFMSGIKTNGSVTTFVNNAGSVAGAIVDFSTNAKNSIDVTSVGNAVWAGKKIAEFLNNIPSTNIGQFATDLPNVSGAIKQFASDLTDLSVPDTTEMISSFQSVANAGINSFTSTFSNATNRIIKIGDDIIANVCKGLSRSKTALVLGFTSAISGMKTAGKQSGSSFAEVGSAMISGIVNGVYANSGRAIAAVSSVCNAMVRVAKSILGIHSPSRVFYEFGEFTVLGFTNAIDDNMGRVYNSTSDMAENARNGISSAIGKISDIINSDIDAEPTIRPVLDLSDVESGSRLINGMFSNRLAIGATADVGSISSMMNSTIQNGGNGDVISAIDKLRDSLGNIGGNTYNVNGVTYDDGSNVSNAVKSLVRAARIERRV